MIKGSDMYKNQNILGQEKLCVYTTIITNITNHYKNIEKQEKNRERRETFANYNSIIMRYFFSLK